MHAILAVAPMHCAAIYIVFRKKESIFFSFNLKSDNSNDTGSDWLKFYANFLLLLIIDKRNASVRLILNNKSSFSEEVVLLMSLSLRGLNRHWSSIVNL